MSKLCPTSIRIFLAERVPEGLRILEKSNWTGWAVVGGSANGRRAWKDARGRTRKALQEERAREA